MLHNEMPTGAAPPSVAAAPFSFQKRRGKLEWRKMAKIDLDRVSREVTRRPLARGPPPARHRPASLAQSSRAHRFAQIDIDTLEAHLENLAFGSLTEDDLHWFTENNFSKLFRLLQMTVEYLLYVQEHLHSRNISLEAMYAESEQRSSTAQTRLQEQAEYVGALEQQIHNSRIVAAAVGARGGTPPTTESCPECGKTFLNIKFLHAHMKRRHPEAPLPAASAPPTSACAPCGPPLMMSGAMPMMAAAAAPPPVDPRAVGEAVHAAVGVAMQSAKSDAATEIRSSLHAQLREALPALANELRGAGGGGGGGGELSVQMQAQIEAQLQDARQAQQGIASQADAMRQQLASMQESVRSSEERLASQLERSTSAVAPQGGGVSEVEVARRLQQQEAAMREMVAAQLKAAQASSHGEAERRALEEAQVAAERARQREAELAQGQEELRRSFEASNAKHAQQLQAMQLQHAESLKDLQAKLLEAPTGAGAGAAGGAPAAPDPRVVALEAKLQEQEAQMAAEREQQAEAKRTAEAAQQEAQRAQEVARKLDKKLQEQKAASDSAVEGERLKAQEEVRRVEAAATAAREEAARQQATADAAKAAAVQGAAKASPAKKATASASAAPTAAVSETAGQAKGKAAAAAAATPTATAAATTASAAATAAPAATKRSGPPQPPPDAKAPATKASPAAPRAKRAPMPSERRRADGKLFEHSAEDWDREREETLVQLDEELAKWKLTGRKEMSDVELERWTKSFRDNSEKTSTFDAEETALARRRVEARLAELVSKHADSEPAPPPSTSGAKLAAPPISPTAAARGRSDSEATLPYESARHEEPPAAAPARPAAARAGAVALPGLARLDNSPAVAGSSGAQPGSAGSGGVHTFNLSGSEDSPDPRGVGAVGASGGRKPGGVCVVPPLASASRTSPGAAETYIDDFEELSP